jgi:hypothetical protein
MGTVPRDQGDQQIASGGTAGSPSRADTGDQAADGNSRPIEKVARGGILDTNRQRARFPVKELMPDPGENLIDRRGRGNQKRHAREEIRERRSA